MGAKIANFLSSNFEVCSWQKGQYEHLWFKDGIFEKRKCGKWEDSKNPSGTHVQYIPDPQFFDTGITDKKYFENFFHDMACLCSGLTISLNNEEIKHNSINELVDRKLNDEIEIIDNRLIIEHKDNSGEFDLALSFCGNSGSKIISYVNYGLTTIGPHITAIKSTITRVFNNWAKEQGLLKAKDKNLDGNSIQEGMLLVCNIVTKNVAYNAQVKTTVTKIDSSFATTTLAKELEFWLDSNPTDAKAIIEKALVARKAAEAAKKAREAVKAKATGVNKATKKKFLDMPTTLIDATSRDRSKCELIIVEGLSAASSLAEKRDATTTAIYSVRGMMINVQKTNKERVLANKEINNLITALGLELDEKHMRLIYDKSKLRYDKIIACSDADAPGAAIENLLFNILWFFCPELILNGHVYSAEPPLFKVTTSDNKYHFLLDQQALNDFMKTHKNIKVVHRAKGLAEQKPEELADSVLVPETRKLKRLQVADVENTKQLFVDLYGDKVPPRVKFINENIWGVEVDYE